jgi:K+-transporting ATPase ATPase C chain
MTRPMVNSSITAGRSSGRGLSARRSPARETLHSRPSAAGNGYDAANSGGSNYAPTNQKLIDRVNGDVAHLQAENPGKLIPIDLVTTSASGLDPDITPAAAEFQVPRVARERGLSEDQVREIIRRHTWDVSGDFWESRGSTCWK